MRVDKLLDIQERYCRTLRRVQELLQRLIQRNLLTTLQVPLRHILINHLRHLAARHLLVCTQTQEQTQLVGHIQWLIETVVRCTSLRLLTGRILQELLHLTQVLAQCLDLRLKSYQNIVGGLHF